MKHAIRHIHFVGIGGAGMSGIAEVLLNQGYRISGSDLAEGSATRRLVAMGAEVFIGHDARHVQGADAIVTSTAVKADNPEVLAARARLVPVVPRAVMLAELMRMKKGVAIAGTHGKTATTSLVASVLAAADMDPTFVIGGRLNSAGANAQLGSGEYIVVAERSDASFLNLLPVLSVVTNIDADHMDTYGHDFGRLKGAFIEFSHAVLRRGGGVCGQRSGARHTLPPQIAHPITSYGFAEDAQVRAIGVQADAGQMRFTVQRRNGVQLPDLEVVLNLPGEHNVQNALAEAIGVAVELGVPDAAVLKALAEFKGVGRRFQRYGQAALAGGGACTLVDDQVTTQVEMAATLAAARGAFPGRRLVLAFPTAPLQRTRDCFEDFVKVIGQADAVLLSEVYAAGEAPIVAADGRALARALRVAGKVEPVFVDGVRCHAAGHSGQRARRRRGAVHGRWLHWHGGGAGDRTGHSGQGMNMKEAVTAIDVKALGKVAVLMGGRSAERAVSLMSGAGVLAALRSRGVDAHPFDPAERDLGELEREGFARCFIALHGRFGEDGTVQGALELLGIPYTGPGVMASAVAMDKLMTKRIWLAEGLATPAWRQVRSTEQTRAALEALGRPMIVKPVREGSTIGLTKVSQPEQCEAAYQLAAQQDPMVMCEQFIAGDEVTCPVLGSGDSARALPVIRIVAPDGNYDYQNKYFTDDTQYLVPCGAGLPEGEEAAIQALVLQAFALDCRGWARADVMIDAATRKPWLLEINAWPV